MPEHTESPKPGTESHAAVLRYILDAIPYKVFWKDRDSNFLGCNQAFATVAGVASPEQILGKSDFDLAWSREEAEFYRQCDLQVMERGEPMVDIEETQQREDGQQVVILTSKVPMRDARGEVSGILGIFTDITYLKEIERDLRQATVRAEQAACAKSAFLATVSHELRTPLTLILSPLLAALEGSYGTLPAPATRALRGCELNARRLLGHVDELLEFSRAEAGAAARPPAWVDVLELARSLVNEAEETARQKGIDLALRAPGGGLAVRVDPDGLAKALSNLLGNALKFTPLGGEVRVALSRRDGGVEVVVRDTGIGIPAALHQAIFEPFQQADGSSTRRYGGVGLGLALVRRFVAGCDGSIQLESSPGQGACFRMWVPGPTRETPPSEADLPRARRVPEALPQALAEPGPEPEGATPVAGRPPVLLAEDDPDLRAHLVELLAGEFAVTATGDGAAALERARREDYAVIVTDLMMPVLDGLGLVRELAADPRTRAVPVLVLTARAAEDELVGAMDLGAQDFLTKPFRPSELRARVRAAARLHALNRELRIAQARLQEAQRLESLGVMAGGIAHNFHNMLAIIQGQVELVGDQLPEDSPAHIDLQVVEQVVQRAEHEVSGILTYAGRAPERCETLRVEDEVRAITHLLAPSMPASVTLELEFDAPPPHLRADRRHLGQLVHQLVTNAAEASTARGGVVSLRVASADVAQVAGDRLVVDEGGPRDPDAAPAAGRYLDLTVVDRGCGMDDATRARVFDPFFTTHFPGRGMGLPTVLGIVRAVRGHLAMESTPGEGTRVSVYLPVTTGGDAGAKDPSGG